MKKYCVLFVLVFCISCNSQKINHSKYAKTNFNAKTMKLIDGNWFDGKKFKERPVWLKNGLMYYKSIEEEVDTVIDLSGKYVIPPFAEAHNHNLESDYKLDERIAHYLNHGIFYVKLLSSIKKRIDPLMHNYNKPDGLDISMAHAPLTATDGHPIALRKKFLEYGHFDGLFNSIEEIEYHGYVIIDDSLDLENKWEKILSFSPNFIKINLLHSEEYAKRKKDTSFFGKKGLNPKLVPDLVKRAHASNLRVSAHVATAHDFHVGVNSNVDEIAHLPEIHNGNPIAMEDAVMAKTKDITVVTTISLVKKDKGKENYQELVENVAANLKILKEAGVTLAIGSDMYNDNSTEEFNFLHELDIFTNLELLTMWTEHATSTIFPNRKIGKLKDGYEGSFLVLDKNPLSDISNIYQRIVLRIKEGVILK
ncbi:hypothetical protein HME9304_03159 [Flagellimonas maritima]|uniref:Amidohydrolase-related domain-containing protein n=1 Tax=Flagellimonas maritima TaxID=1383885 RepID=A0A2Z4LXU0_9FLAO|nr:hypothetical protein [Allomuricauda aurantiaca]AWX46127.1 hypothetical protein HME9304_03159 [Allomuricauda aurantiaca]